MSDLISRRVAIEAILEDKIDSESLEIMRVLGDGMQAQMLNDTCDRHAQIIKTLPSAESERKKGRWAEDEKGYFYCTNCELYPHDQSYKTDFCPNCGTDMR